MKDGEPKLVAINHDDYHAQHIGRMLDGRQFFLTTPFEPAFGDEKPGCEYIALFTFDSAGVLLEAKIESFGPRATLDDAKCKEVYDSWLKELGEVSFERIEVAPFSVERFGTQFGLIPREPEDEEDVWAVELLPGNYMAFFSPWDSGDYDI
jgi:hypothetical protein